MTSTPRFAMVAGEASGDLLAGLLLGGMRQRWPELGSGELFGIGGPRMAEQGFNAWWPHEKLAVRGYVEVLRHYREIADIRKQLAQRLLADPPRAFIGVDAPDFNLDLEAQLRVRGIKAIHFVCPSIWAWRGKRVEKIKRSVDHVLCLFPFEPQLLAQHGIAATYVGHPLADAIPLDVDKAAARASLGLDASAPVVALLPGSRRSEVHYIAPRFAQAAALMHRQRPDVKFILPAIPSLKAMVEPVLHEFAPGVPVQLLEGRSHEALAACDVTLIASGTATLEAALFKRPMVIAYNMHFLSWQLMKRMGYQPWVGLPNILCREFVVPELLQGEASPEALARETLRWLDDRSRYEQTQARFVELHHMLKRDTARCATDAIAQIVEP